MGRHSGFMTTANFVEIYLDDEEATANAARRLAPCLRAGDCVLLSGSLGTGKTHFARALIQSRMADLGKVEDVPSPTFTLVQTYDLGDVEIWHADLYRLSDPFEVVELGLEEAFCSAIALVEWPERLGDMAPNDALEITLTSQSEGRLLRAEWRDERLSVLDLPHV